MCTENFRAYIWKGVLEQAEVELNLTTQQTLLNWFSSRKEFCLWRANFSTTLSTYIQLKGEF